nr:hypothetical protein [Tanacetum cinerariifolium]
MKGCARKLRKCKPLASSSNEKKVKRLPKAAKGCVNREEAPRLAVEVKKAAGIHIAILFGQAGVPVKLVDKRIPRETEHRHALLADAQDVDPLLPKPGRSQIGLEYVGFGVHYRLLVALVIVVGDIGPAQHIHAGANLAVGQNYFFITAVVVVAHNLVAGRLAGHKPVVLLAGHAVIVQIIDYFTVGVVRVQQVERGEAQLVFHLHGGRALGAQLVRKLGRLALHNYAVGPVLGNLLRAHNAGRRAVLESRYEALVRLQLLVPNAVFAARPGRDVNLVYG